MKRSWGRALLGGALAVLVVVLAVFAMLSEDAPMPSDAALNLTNTGAYTPVVPEEQYYHRPVLVTASTTVGPGAGAWRGLCEYLQTDTQQEACYLSADTVQALGQTIEQSVWDMAPSAIVMAAGQASATVVDAQSVYQGTYFLVLDGTVPVPAENVCNLTFAVEQAGFLAGYAAGMEGFERLAFWGEAEDEQTLLYQSGFYQGADRAAQNLGKQVTISAVFGAEPLPEGIEMAFVCGSMGFEMEKAQQAADAGIDLIGTDPGILVQMPEAANTMLTFAVKNYAGVTLSALHALDSGAWNQFYCGQTLRYDLQWGNAVMLDTTQWRFSNFTAAQYNQIVASLAKDEAYTVSQQLPAEVLERVQTS